MKTNNYFTTGELAELANVNKDTLFYYDKIGLFKPLIVKENGYRYYAIYQLDILLVILTLKEFDMSLEDIKKYIDSRSPENLLKLVNGEIYKIEKKINRLNSLKKDLNLLNDRLEVLKKNKYLEVFQEHCEEEYLYVHKKDIISASKEKMFLQTMSSFLEELDRKNISCFYVDFIKDKKDKDNNLGFEFDYLYVNVANKKQSNYVKKAGNYLSIIINDNIFEEKNVFSILIDYAKKNDINIGDQFYLISILDESSVSSYKDYVTKISINII